MMRKGIEMREITDFDREWVSEIAGYEVSDEEIVQFLQDLEDFGDSEMLVESFENFLRSSGYQTPLSGYKLKLVKDSENGYDA